MSVRVHVCVCVHACVCVRVCVRVYVCQLQDNTVLAPPTAMTTLERGMCHTHLSMLVIYPLLLPVDSVDYLCQMVRHPLLQRLVSKCPARRSILLFTTGIYVVGMSLSEPHIYNFAVYYIYFVCRAINHSQYSCVMTHK